MEVEGNLSLPTTLPLRLMEDFLKSNSINVVKWHFNCMFSNQIPLCLLRVWLTSNCFSSADEEGNYYLHFEFFLDKNWVLLLTGDEYIKCKYFYWWGKLYKEKNQSRNRNIKPQHLNSSGISFTLPVESFLSDRIQRNGKYTSHISLHSA